MSIWSIWVLATGLLAATVGGAGVWLGRRSTAGRHHAEGAAARRVAQFAAWRADWRARFHRAAPDLSDAYDVYDDPDAGWSR